MSGGDGHSSSCETQSRFIHVSFLLRHCKINPNRWSEQDITPLTKNHLTVLPDDDIPNTENKVLKTLLVRV